MSVVPFLAAVAAASGADVRPFAATLAGDGRAESAAPVVSLWRSTGAGAGANAGSGIGSGSNVTLGAGASSAGPTEAEQLLAAARADAAKLRAEAAEAGRADGQRALDDARAKLTALAAKLTAAEAALATRVADLVAAASCTVIEAWIGRAITGADRFAPIVRGWVAGDAQPGAAAEPAVARVHPSDADALREAIGDAPISVEPDSSIAPGDVLVASASREVRHAWSTRLGELREAIATAVEAG